MLHCFEHGREWIALWSIKFIQIALTNSNPASQKIHSVPITNSSRSAICTAVILVFVLKLRTTHKYILSVKVQEYSFESEKLHQNLWRYSIFWLTWSPTRIFACISNVTPHIFIQEKHVYNKHGWEKWNTLYVQYNVSTHILRFAR
jgi:hypothetical protein